MERTRTARNVAIVVAIAAAVYLLPGGGRASNAFEAALWAAFAGGIGYLLLRVYRERRIALHSLGDYHRGLLYGGLALAVFAYAAQKRMWETGFGELAWFALVAAVIYALMEVYRHSRTF
jgi:cyanate permease